MLIEGAASHLQESMPTAASPSPVFLEIDPFFTYNAAFRPAIARGSTEASQAMPPADASAGRVRDRTSRSFSGISDVKNGIGLRLRRASTSIKTVFASASKHNAREADVPARKQSVDEHGARRGAGSIFRRRRSEATVATPAVSSSGASTGSSQVGQLEPPHVPYDASQGSAARAFAARENVRLAIPKTIIRRDSNIGLLHEDRDRESGIHISVDTYDLVESSGQSQIRRRDPVSILPAELMSTILSNLDVKSLRAAEAVSKEWRVAAADLYVWREVYLQKYGSNDKVEALPIPVGGRGLGKGRYYDQNWKKMYKARHELAENWKNGNAKAIYLNGHTDSVYCVQYDEDKVITGSRDRTIRVWDIRTFKCLKVIGIPCALENDRRESAHAPAPTLATQAMSIQTTPSGDPDPSIYHVPHYYHEASILCLQYDEEIMVTGSSDNTLIVWDIQTWQPIRRLYKHDAGVLDIAFDKQKLVSCSKDTTICVWDRATGALLQQLAGHRGPVNAVQLRGDLVVSASGEGCAKLWNLGLSNGAAGGARCVKEFWSRDRGLACVEFSSDAQYVLAGGNDMVIYKFSTATGECVSTLAGHAGLVRSLYLDGANGRIVSGSYDLSLRVWDYETGEETIHFPNWTTSWMLSAKSDYRRIVSTSQDGRALIMDFGWAVDGVELLEA